VASEYEMRVSDAEREAAATELREHFASGRLNSDELDQRLTAAFAARTRADLNALYTDLPSAGPGWAAAVDQPDWAGARASRASGPGAFGKSGSSGKPAPFGNGPFGAGASGPGPFGAGSGPFRASAGRAFGRAVAGTVLVWVLLIVGILGVFGIGTGRPIGVVLILAAFALLRRLLLMIFGRRRGGGRGRGGRGGGPRRRGGRF
jgi:hypothetical protein